MDELFEMIKSNPEAVVAMIKSYIGKYKPVVYQLAQEVLEIYKDYSNNTEYPAVVAKVKKNMYDAYISAGFTADQALALMINDNIQLMQNIKKTASNVSRKESKE